MTEAYTQFLAEKLVRTETALNYAVKRLREIVFKYDEPFLEENIRNMFGELNRLKNYLDNEIHHHDPPTA